MELAGLTRRAIDGEDHWMLDVPVDADPPPVMLLPCFDEYISYARDARDFGHVAGTWNRTMSVKLVRIDVVTTPPMTKRLHRSLTAEAEAFGSFVGLEAHPVRAG